MATPRGLGRGLGSLIPKKSAAPAAAVKEPETSAAEAKVLPPSGIPLVVPIERILPNPLQPRERFSHAEMEELVVSIKAHGIIQPLIVTEKPDGTFELIAGERRLRAARLAGLSGVPVIIRGALEKEKLELALIENLQREDLNPIEEARAYRRLVDEYGLSQEEIAGRVGKSRSQVSNTMRLLELPEDIQQDVRSGKLPGTAARALLSLPTREEQVRWWQKLAQEKLTVRDIEEAARRSRGPRSVVIPDANLEADEAAMRGALGTKVQVKKRGESGTITLTFYSTEEYRSLVDRLSKAS